MTLTFFLGLVFAVAVGVIIGTHPKRFFITSLALGWIVLLFVVYGLLIGGVFWFVITVSNREHMPIWQTLLVLGLIIGIGIFMDRLGKKDKKRGKPVEKL